MNPSPSYPARSAYRINTPKKTSADRLEVNLPPAVTDNPGQPLTHLQTIFACSRTTRAVQVLNPAQPSHLRLTLQNHCDTTPGPSRPLLINPATVTPTRQEPIQISLDEAVDLLNELRTICEILLPGHGQFLCHFIYLCFLQHIRLPDQSSCSTPDPERYLKTLTLLTR